MNFLGTSEQRSPSAHRPHLRLLRGGPRHDREAPSTELESQDGPSATQNRPSGAQDGSSDGPSGPQDGSFGPLDGPPASQDGRSVPANPGPAEGSPTPPERSRILIAGADPRRRAAVLADLTEALPVDTPFGEAGAAWEVLEQAPSSGVVMLAGDLDEVTAESLMHVLGHRHPSLPVVALGLFADGGPADGRHSGRAASVAG
jgi:hypothetical protein